MRAMNQTPGEIMNENLQDEIRDKVDHDGLMEELTDEFENGDCDDALARLKDLGYDIDDLSL